MSGSVDPFEGMIMAFDQVALDIAQANGIFKCAENKTVPWREAGNKPNHKHANHKHGIWVFHEFSSLVFVLQGTGGLEKVYYVAMYAM